MHVPRSAARVAVTALWLLTRAALASAQGAALPLPRPAPVRPAQSSLLGRWLDVQQASVSIRYREVETSDGDVTSNHAQYGFAVTADKVLFKNKLVLSGGFASVDRRHTLNADRFFTGNRLFVGGIVPLSREWTVSGYITRAVHNDYRVPLGMRIDAVVQYSFVPALRRLNVIP